MILCDECDRPIVGPGAFLPGDDPDLVCVSCFQELVGHPPIPQGMVPEQEISRLANLTKHRVGGNSPKFNIPYTVSVTNTASAQVRKKLAKRNVLALKNLPPGNYTASYRVNIGKARKKIY